jgi:hypothetical protein
MGFLLLKYYDAATIAEVSQGSSSRTVSAAPCVGKKGRRKQKHEKREELSFGQETDHRGIGLAELFTENPENGIEREEHTRD